MIKGQAAVTDALLFLVIVMILVSFLFIFTSQYGRTVGEYTYAKYGSDYAVSALKTVLYSSFSRNDFSVSDSNEVDYIIAGIKEDYAYNQNIDYFRDDLTGAIKDVMNPVRSSFDYLFFIRIDSTVPFNFPYFFLSRKEFVVEHNGVFVSSVDSVEKTYFCNSSGSLTNADIDNFVIFVGAKGQAVSSITFPLIPNGSHEGLIELVLWTPKDFDEEEEVFIKLGCVPA